MNWREHIVHWTQLPDDPTTGGNATEWNFYRREVGRLLVEGHDDRWALIKGEQVVGIWDTQDDALAVARERYFGQPVLVKQILEWEPLVSVPHRWNYAPAHVSNQCA
jgi:hypothetical protein